MTDIDVEKPVHWFDRATGKGLIRVGVLLIILPLALGFLRSDRIDRPGGWIFLGAFVLFGVWLVVWGLFADDYPGNPALALSSDGVYMSIRGAKEFVIPWSEISQVETIDFEAPIPGNAGEFFRSARFQLMKDLTALTVSKAFYEPAIHTRSWFRRGPGWNNIFVDRGESYQVLIYHGLLAQPAEVIRREIEARWRAFAPGNAERPGN